MGERSRVAFTRLLLSGANFLVLDEPTNYLDLAARERMEDVLSKYSGGLLFVTHDLYFIRKIANKIICIEENTLKYYGGNYDYYCAKRQQEASSAMLSADAQERILLLECDLAYLAGKLGQTSSAEEREVLHRQYEEKAALLQAARCGK